MSDYLCPNCGGTRTKLIMVKSDTSPHKTKMVCANCKQFVKWGTHKDSSDQGSSRKYQPGLCFMSTGESVRDCDGSLCELWDPAEDRCSIVSIMICLRDAANALREITAALKEVTKSSDENRSREANGM